MRGLRVWAKQAKQAKREKRAKQAKRRAQLAILAAALGFASWSVWGVGETCGVGNVGAVATAQETASTKRPIVAAPRDGKLAKPSACKAFLVAADNYGSAATALPCAKNDVEALKKRLESLGFTTVVLETGGDPQYAPTKTTIERRFKEFVESLKPGDFVIVYLSGHGIQPANSEESFFAPVDVDVKNLFDSSVSINAMLDALKESDASFRWMLVDACRDDPLNPADDSGAPAIKDASKSFGARALGEIANVPDSVALSQSCQPGKRSYEGGGPGATKIKNGFFTLSLLEALDESDPKADANRDGVLSFLEAAEYVSRRTNELATTCYGEAQTPNLSGSITNFALLDGLRVPPPPPPPKSWLPLALLTLTGGAAGVAYWAGRRQGRPAPLATSNGANVSAVATGPASATPEAPSVGRPSASGGTFGESDAERRAEADKLAAEAWTAFDLGGVANVEKAIKLMKESLKLVELTANRRALKTFESELEALRKARAEEERKKREAEERAAKRRAEADKLAADALAAFDLGGVANVEKAIKLMKESLALAESTANRRALKTFEEKLEALRKASVAASNGWSAEHKAGTRKTLRIKGVEYAFRYCPPGTFTMGSPKSESGRDDDETQHEVTLTNGFWMLETPVTQAMWKAVMGNNPSAFSSGGSYSSDVRGMDTSNFPVESVSWNDCQDFIKKLNSQGLALDGFKFRLPSEAEWEYACRAGTTKSYFWGSSLNGDKANCDGDYPCGTRRKGQSLGRTTKVGSYASNPWGLYDMHGNVLEWCEDLYAGYENIKTSQNPINVTMGSSRVVRGGGWIVDAGNCRSADRNGFAPTYRSNSNGFRLALVRSSSSSK